MSEDPVSGGENTLRRLEEEVLRRVATGPMPLHEPLEMAQKLERERMPWVSSREIRDLLDRLVAEGAVSQIPPLNIPTMLMGNAERLTLTIPTTVELCDLARNAVVTGAGLVDIEPRKVTVVKGKGVAAEAVVTVRIQPDPGEPPLRRWEDRWSANKLEPVSLTGASVVQGLLQLRPGEKVSAHGLADLLSIGYTSVLTHLKKYANAGLLEHDPRLHGRTPQQYEVIDAYELRKLVEPPDDQVRGLFAEAVYGSGSGLLGVRSEEITLDPRAWFVGKVVITFKI